MRYGYPVLNRPRTSGWTGISSRLPCPATTALPARVLGGYPVNRGLTSAVKGGGPDLPGELFGCVVHSENAPPSMGEPADKAKGRQRMSDHASHQVRA